MERKDGQQSPGREIEPVVLLERHLERSLCDYPELIDDSLFGIKPGMAALGSDYPTLKKQDSLPNGRKADIVFVEKLRITVVEVKRGILRVQAHSPEEDVVDQITDYLRQCRLKYPNREEYRGFIIGTGIADRNELARKLASVPDKIVALIYGSDIPKCVRICTRCYRAVPFQRDCCVCEKGGPVTARGPQ
jgi:hypothetical protein